MREFKFKIWDKTNKSFLYCSDDDDLFINMQGDIYLASETLRDAYDLDYLSSSFYEISQYTGLKDKDGTEIYEGDIVKIINVCDCINCKRYKQAPRIVKVDFLDFNTLKLIATGGEFGNYETEIIGNIFENSELLQGGENE